jgi:hypothetical protein
VQPPRFALGPLRQVNLAEPSSIEWRAITISVTCPASIWHDFHSLGQHSEGKPQLGRVEKPRFLVLAAGEVQTASSKGLIVGTSFSKGHPGGLLPDSLPPLDVTFMLLSSAPAMLV